MQFLYKQTTNQRQFSSNRYPLSRIKFIVVHASSNFAKTANAMNHWRYLNHATRYGSAHYYVDDKYILQVVGDSRIAWSVGDNQGYGYALNGATNYNSINVEMCMNEDADQSVIYKATVELVKVLMKRFNVSHERVCRHYDVTRKSCPINFMDNDWEKWEQFKNDIKKAQEWIIDLDKSSEIIMNNTEVKEMTEYITQGKINIIKTTADNIYTQQLGGKTLAQVGAVGVNGVLYDTPKPQLASSTWCIAVNGGVPIGENAVRNHPNKNIKRGTMIYDGQKVTVKIHCEGLNISWRGNNQDGVWE